MKLQRFLAYLTILFSILSAGFASAAQLVTNGDFSSGNIDFTTQYSLTTTTPYLFQNGVHGIYTIIGAPNIAPTAQYGDWTNINTDPFGGSGNVFLADGGDETTVPSVLKAWSETVSVVPHTNYTFSFYGAEVSNPCCSNALLQASINGTAGNSIATSGVWQNTSYIWNSGSSTQAILAITDLNTSGGFNDFA
jgi:hypothetical protein